MSVATSLTVAELIGDVLGDHDTRLDTAEGNISTLQTDLSTAQSDISTNQGNISTNQSDISDLQSNKLDASDTKIPTQDEKDALAGTSTPNGANPFVNQADFASTQSDVSNLQSDISTAQSDISTNQSNISTNQFNISTNQSDISTLQSDVTTAQSDISTLQSDVTTAQSDIGTNQTDISSLQTDKLDASDTRIPSQDENDALAGTGTPGSGDPFVNDSDSRLLQAQNFEISAKNLSATDDRVIVVCDAATTADIDIDSATPSDTYDGVTLTEFDVLLVHNQSDASENGAYIFTDTSTQLSRYVGLNTSAGFAGRKRQFVVRDGDSQKGFYISDEPSGFVLDTDDLEFSQLLATAAYFNAGTGANEVLKLDGSGKLTAALIDTLLSHPDIRGTATPHIGPYPNLPFNVMDNDGSVFLYAQNKMLFISTEDGEFQVPIGLATQKDDGELDIEVILADGTQVSIGDLDSDDIGMDGRSLRPGYQLPSIGPYGAEKVIQTRGF